LSTKMLVKTAKIRNLIDRHHCRLIQTRNRALETKSNATVRGYPTNSDYEIQSSPLERV
jgi:hypothetical protein